MAYPHWRVHPKSWLGSARRSVLVLQTRSSVVRVGMAFRCHVRLAVSATLDERDCADLRTSHIPVRNFQWGAALRYAYLAAACAAASIVNPYGIGLHRHLSEYLRSDWIKNAIQEFQSPSFRSETMLQFEGLLFLGLVAASALVRRRR